jgi:hypothetical protein
MTVTPARMEAAASDTSRRHIVPLSGGKDSTALSIYLSQAYPRLSFEFVFCDTGAELPETYEYLDRLEYVLGRAITRISALEMLDVSAKPGRSAFDVVLYDYFNGYLPSPRSRWCTRMLKIHPYEKYIGSAPAYSYIAIRADENRQGYASGGKPVLMSEEPNIVPVYPFKDDGFGFADVRACSTTAGSGYLGTTNGAAGPAATSASTSRSPNGRGSRSATPPCSKGRRPTRRAAAGNTLGSTAARWPMSRRCRVGL